MAEESPGNQPKHAERVRRSRNKKYSLTLPPHSKYDWPKNLGELIEWYTHEVEDIARAAQLRIKEATTIVVACSNREISLEAAAQQHNRYHSRWRDLFPGGIQRIRGMTDEEIYDAIKNAKEGMKGGSSR